MLRLDLWLRFKARRDTEAYEMLRADMADAFVPFDQEWREVTLVDGLEITRQAVKGLSTW